METPINPPFTAFDYTTQSTPFIVAIYAHEDATEVYPILERLYAEQIPIWYDEGGEIMEEIKKKITDAIWHSRIVIVFLSRETSDPELKREIEVALDRYNKGEICIIPVCVDFVISKLMNLLDCNPLIINYSIYNASFDILREFCQKILSEETPFTPQIRDRIQNQCVRLYQDYDKQFESPKRKSFDRRNKAVRTIFNPISGKYNTVRKVYNGSRWYEFEEYGDGTARILPAPRRALLSGIYIAESVVHFILVFWKLNPIMTENFIENFLVFLVLSLVIVLLTLTPIFDELGNTVYLVLCLVLLTISIIYISSTPVDLIFRWYSCVMVGVYIVVAGIFVIYKVFFEEGVIVRKVIYMTIIVIEVVAYAILFVWIYDLNFLSAFSIEYFLWTIGPLLFFILVLVIEIRNGSHDWQMPIYIGVAFIFLLLYILI